MKDTAHIILKFEFYFYQNKIKLNQTLKFDGTDTIKVKSITMDKAEYMTY